MAYLVDTHFFNLASSFASPNYKKKRYHTLYFHHFHSDEIKKMKKILLETIQYLKLWPQKLLINVQHTIFKDTTIIKRETYR